MNSEDTPEDRAALRMLAEGLGWDWDTLPKNENDRRRGDDLPAVTQEDVRRGLTAVRTLDKILEQVAEAGRLNRSRVQGDEQ